MKRNLKWLALASCIFLIVFFVWHNESKAKSAKPAGSSPEIPVETAMVEKGDVPEVVDALGTVTPIASVSIVSRVQGQIMQVNYHEGQIVHKGDSLIEIDAGPYQAALAQAEGQAMRDESLLKEARINLIRYRQAYQLHAVSKQQYQDQMEVVAQDEGVVKSDQGAVQNAKINLSYCHIQAPIEGRIGLRLMDAGNMVQANSTTPLVVITQIKPITVVFNVAEDHLNEIQSELTAEATTPNVSMTVDAYDRSHEKRLASGRFLTLDNSIDPTTGTIKVKAIFENEDGALFPNQFVNARLLVHTKHDATLLTSSAIQRNAQGPFVYKIGPDQKAKIQTIQVGTVSGENTEVTGVSPGDVVASAGFDKLQEGAKVKAENAQREKQ